MTARRSTAVCWVVGLLGFAGMPGQVSAQAGHGTCSMCHVTHSAPGPSLTLNPDIDILCLSCHGPAGPAAEASVHSVTKGGAQTFSCVECHTPHSNPPNWLAGTNIQRAGRTWLSSTGYGQVTTPNSGIRDVVFESQGFSQTPPSFPTLHSFADNDQDGNGVRDGICEVCHTLTNYHRNNVSDPNHETGNNCTECHPHTAGFMPTGGTGCIGCHSSVKGSGTYAAGTLRRAVVGVDGDFQNSIGGHFVGTDATDYQCIVCHAEGYFDAGEGVVKVDSTYHNQSSAPYTGTPYTVDLRNVDDPTAVFPVRTDPSSWPQVLTPNGTHGSPTNVFKNNLTEFCLRCHDTDGATVHQSADPGASGSATDPFGIGQTPMDLVTKFQTSNYSTHGINSQRSGLGPVTRTTNLNSYVNSWGNSSITECADCHLGEDTATTPTYYHNAHGSRNLNWLLADMDGLDQVFASTREDDESTVTCFRCHRNTTYGGGGDENWSRFGSHSKTAHVDRSKNTFSIGCLNCHGGYEAAGGGIHGTNAIITDANGNGNGTYPAIRFTNGANLDYFGPGQGQGGSTLCSTNPTVAGNNLGCTNHSSKRYDPNY